MSLSFKEINIGNPGTSTKFGGNDTDIISKLLNGVIGGIPPVTIKSANDFGFGDGVAWLYNQAANKKTTLRGQSNTPTTDVDLTLPPITGNDVLPALNLAQAWLQKQQFNIGITLQEMATPSNPTPGFHHLYYGLDGHLYGRNSSGVLRDYDSPGGLHGITHKSGGTDSIKLDEFAAPTDITTLNASITAHGLLPKLSNVSTQYLSGTGTWTTPAGGGGGAPTGSAGGDLAGSTYPNPVIANDVITYAKMQNVSTTSRILGRYSPSVGDIEELTGTQATSLLDLFTSGLKGLVPLSGGGSTNFLRADGTWSPPPGASGGEINTASNLGIGTGLFKSKVGVDLQFKTINAGSGAISITDDIPNNEVDIDIPLNSIAYARIQDVSTTSRLLGRIAAGAGDIQELTGTQVTSLLDTFTSSLNGLVPFSGGGTVNYLRADGAWTTPSGAGGGETNTASNVGTAGQGVYDGKVGVDLQFRKLNPLSSKISIIADTVNKKIDFDVPDGSTTVKGAVELATDGEAIANVVVQGNDSRLSNSRTPGGSATGDLTGTYPAPTVALNAIGNTKLADMAANSVKVNNSLSVTDPTDLTVGTNTVVGRVTGNIVAAQLVDSQITNDTISNVSLANMAANSIKANATALSADPSDLGVGTDTVVGRTSGNIIAATLATTQITNSAVTYAKIQNVAATSRFLGRITTGAGVIEELTGTQATTLLDVFTSALKGVVPSSGGGTANFLRADGTWNAPPGGAPSTSSYVTIATDASLSNERTLAVGDGLTLTDGGAGNPVTLDIDVLDQAKKRVSFVDDMFGDSTTGGSYFQKSIAGTAADLSNLGVSETGIFGAWQLSTGTLATGRCAIGSGNARSFSLGQGAVTLEMKVKTTNLSTSAERYKLTIGLADSLSGTIANAVQFVYDEATSTFWRIQTMKASVTTITNTTSTANNAWQRYKIVINAAGTSVAFYINDTQVSGSPITTNIPGAGDEVTVQLRLEKSVGTTARTTNIDYVAFSYDLTTPR
jgi:hypothetical protein